MDDEQNAGGVSAPLRRPAADPAIARPDRGLLSASRTGERLAATMSGAVTGLVAAALVAVGGATPWAIGVLVFLGPAGWQSALARWAMLLAAVVAAPAVVILVASFIWSGQFSGRQASAVAARADSGRYLTAGDFDARAAALLRRAQDAIDAVTASEVWQVGLLDVVAHGTALAAQEWEIALAVREQARLRQARAQLPVIADDSAARELLDSHHEAAEFADRSVAGRVAALEQLAAEVRRADSAYRDWRGHAAVSELADRHMDMLARTAADSHAVAEIAAISQQARAVHLALRDLSAR